MTAHRHSNASSPAYRGDPLFKGCTRPAMLFGVPVVPVVALCGTLLLLAIWTTPFVAGAIPLAIGVMRMMVKEDDQQFRLLGLKFLFRVAHPNRTGRFWKASSYSPSQLTKRK